MKNIKTKYSKFLNIIALLGYLWLVYFSGFHHHVKFIPTPKSESRINLPQNFISIDHDDCEICYFVNSSSNVTSQIYFEIPVDNSKIILSFNQISRIVYGFKGSVKNLRAPPSIIS